MLHPTLSPTRAKSTACRRSSRQLAACQRIKRLRREKESRSAGGRSLPKWVVRARSAFPLISTKERTSRPVRKGPISDSRTAAYGFLLDHLVGAADQRQRESKTERLGGLEIYDELNLGDLLDREVG